MSVWNIRVIEHDVSQRQSPRWVWAWMTESDMVIRKSPKLSLKQTEEVIVIWAMLHYHQHHEYQKVIIKFPFEGNSALMLSCVMGKQFPLFSSLSCVHIHRQTYPHTFCKHHTHIHKNIHEEDLGLQSLSVQVHGSNGDLKQTEIWYQVVNTSLILQMTHADKFAHTSPQNTC